ncbi:type IV toxin-antitoxin system AbiEi family antitoxin [Luteococcus sp. H138]|uniref:type IV toxin-antitoxin system AbiEi family antitoxin n=1 Tax=unclassified Luteococcus TaxID=2639923 RepID=UPI00313BAF99
MKMMNIEQDLLDVVEQHADEHGLRLFHRQALDNETGRRPDARISIPTRTGETSLDVEVKTSARYDALHAPRRADIIIQPYINPAQAERYRAAGQYYLDAAGNGWIEADGYRLLVDGRKPADWQGSRHAAGFTPGTTRLVFVALVAPAIITATTRDLARAADISLGAVSTALKTLDYLGHLDGTPRDRHGLKRVDELVDRWLAGFQDRLLPTLRSRTATTPQRDALLSWHESHPSAATLAGEAVEPTIHNPESITLYAPQPWTSILQEGRLRPTPNGDVILRKRFWDEEVLHLGPTAPPLLTCAELLASHDPRLQEAGRSLRGRLHESRR